MNAGSEDFPNPSFRSQLFEELDTVEDVLEADRNESNEGECRCARLSVLGFGLGGVGRSEGAVYA